MGSTEVFERMKNNEIVRFRKKKLRPTGVPLRSFSSRKMPEIAGYFFKIKRAISRRERATYTVRSGAAAPRYSSI